MTLQPDLSQVHLREMWNHPDHPYMNIPPTGYLIGLNVAVNEDDFIREVLHFEVTSANGVPLFGGFDLMPEFTQAGMVFPEPLPNVNSQCPYVLYMPHGRSFKVTTINAHLKREAS